jgi:4-hydroxy-tetrahydrodipicolinate reductase
MGKAIEAIAIERGHTIVHRLGKADGNPADVIARHPVDAIIEFTHPTVVLENLRQLIPSRIPIVVGTTGWNAHWAEVEQQVTDAESALVYGANFSVGVNLMFRLTQELARLMNRFPAYDPYVEERHHRHKADAPGGTALQLAAHLLHELDRKTEIAPAAELLHRPPKPEELSVSFTRAGEIPGEHVVGFTSGVDSLEIRHKANNRSGFALGAVLAAEWVQGRRGCYPFEKVLEG